MHVMSGRFSFCLSGIEKTDLNESSRALVQRCIHARIPHMKFLTLLFAAAIVSAAPLKAQDPNAILEGARLSATLVNLDDGLDGYLSHDRKKIPIKIFLKGKNIQFLFLEGKQWRVFHMRLADNRYDLFEIIDGKTIKFDRDKLVQPIANTDLTYEDLALRFFYWPNPKLEGKENVGNSADLQTPHRQAGQCCRQLQISLRLGSPKIWRLHANQGLRHQRKAHQGIPSRESHESRQGHLGIGENAGLNF